jgi:hypothetical protein
MPPSFSHGFPPNSAHRQLQGVSYAASPLQKALTPPPFDSQRNRDSDLEPFPSIESSVDSSMSGKNFHMSGSALPSSANSDTSPLNAYPLSSQLSQNHRTHHRFSNPTPSTFRNRDIQVYCANCSRAFPLAECYACTECICGVCRECVSFFISSPPLSLLNPARSPNKAPSASGSSVSSGPTSYGTPRGCPRCRTVGGKWKAFQLDFR